MALVVQNVSGFIKITEDADVITWIRKASVAEVVHYKIVGHPPVRERIGDTQVRYVVEIRYDGKKYPINLAGETVDSPAKVTTPNTWVNSLAGATQAVTDLLSWINTP